MTDLEILKASIAEGLTQSELTTMDECNRLWYWRYGRKIRRRGSAAWPLLIGSMYHKSWERFYSSPDKWIPAQIEVPPDVMRTQAFEEELIYWNAVGPVQMTRYAEYFRTDRTCFNIKFVEKLVEFEWEGYLFRAKMDLGWELDALDWIVDHKTSGKAVDEAMAAAYDTRFQFMFYAWMAIKSGLMPKCAGFVVNVLKKPTIRQKKGESFPGFIDRLSLNMNSEPQDYYYRNFCRLVRGQMERFEEKVLRPKLTKLKLLTNAQEGDMIVPATVGNMNDGHCFRYSRQCEYFRLCHHNTDEELFQFTPREQKHPELDGEDSAE